MENATKALLIAAGVLIGIIILSMLLLGYNQISNYYQQQSDNLSLRQIVELNKKFTNYDGKTIRGNEMLSVINSVVDYNTWVAQNANEGYEEIQLNISFEMSKTDSRWTSFHIEESSSYDYLFPNNSPITNTNMKKISTRKNDLLTKFSNLSQTGFVSSNVVSENTLQLLSSNVHTIRDWLTRLTQTTNDMSQSQKERYDENNVKAAKIIDKILQTKFTDNTAEETQRNMLAQKSKIEKIEQIAAEYYELTQFKRTYFLCEGEETGKSGVLIASNGKVKAMNFKIVLNNDQGHTIKFN